MGSPQPVCTYFIRNRCRNGDHCPYHHPADLQKASLFPATTVSPAVHQPNPNAHYLRPAAHGRVPAEVCRFWLAGVCKKNERCPYLHQSYANPVKIGPTPPSLSPSPSVPQPTGPTSDFFKAQPECRFWKLGSCQKGEGCSFRHGNTSIIGAKISFTSSKTMQDMSEPPFKQAISPLPLTTWIPKSSIENLDKVDTPSNPCKFWMRGSCLRGSSCMFYHPPTTGLEINAHPQASTDNEHSTLSHKAEVVRPAHAVPLTHPASPVQLEPLVTSKIGSYTKVFGSTLVIYSSGVSVSNIIPSSESSCLLVSNLPIGFTKPNLDNLLRSYSSVVSCDFPGSTLTGQGSSGTDPCGTSALVYLSDKDQARAVCEKLDGFTVEGHLLSCKWRSIQESASGVLRASTVRVSWYPSSRLAFAKYPEPFVAAIKARFLNKTLYLGRVISAECDLARNPYVMVLRDLPSSSRYEELSVMADTNDLELHQPNYDEQVGDRKVRELVNEISPVESYSAQDRKNSKTFKAIVKFRDSQAASTAVKLLNNTKHEFLGNGPLFVQLLPSARYYLLSLQYAVIRSQLLQLRDDLRQSVELGQIHIFEPQDSPSVTITLSGNNPKGFLEARGRLQALLIGKQVTDQGRNAIWDDFFATKQGLDFIHSVNQSTGSFVHRDNRNRYLSLYGNEDAKHRARALIDERFRQLRQYIGPLEVTTWQLLLRGGLQGLRQVLGEEKVIADITARVILIRGDSDEDFEVASRFIANLTSEPHLANTTSGDNDCPICLCEACDPVILLCHHQYCSSCFENLLLASANNRAYPIQCSAVKGDSTCNEPIPLTLIGQHLPRREEERVFKSAFEAHIRRNPDQFRYCPTTDCKELYRPSSSEGKTSRCPACLIDICLTCHVENHEGLSCAEYQEDSDTSPEAMAFKKYKKENDIRPCPKCKAPVFKDGGCNHVTCAKCGAHICWVCMDTFSQGQMTYTHMNKVHGNIYT